MANRSQTTRHVWIELEVQWFRELGFGPVEATDLVGTVVRAVPRADTPVVDLGVQTLVRVIRGKDRTDGLAGCVVAVLTEHRQKAVVDMCFRHLHKPLDPHPRHGAAPTHGVGSHDRNIVLRVAGRDTGIAPVAGVEVDRHSPVMDRVLVIRTEAEVILLRVYLTPGQSRQRCGLCQLTAVLGEGGLESRDASRDIEWRSIDTCAEPAPTTRCRFGGRVDEEQRVDAASRRVASVIGVTLPQRYGEDAVSQLGIDQEARIETAVIRLQSYQLPLFGAERAGRLG